MTKDSSDHQKQEIIFPFLSVFECLTLLVISIKIPKLSQMQLYRGTQD